MTADRRTDSARTAVAARVVDIDRTLGCVFAWAYGLQHGISSEILLRILSGEELCRVTDRLQSTNSILSNA